MIVSFKEYNKKGRDLSHYKVKILSVIDDFIIYDNDFRERNTIKDYKSSFDVYYKKMKNDWVNVVQYYYGEHKRQYEVTFTKDEFDKLKIFMENPELYKNSKNYNL